MNVHGALHACRVLSMNVFQSTSLIASFPGSLSFSEREPVIDSIYNVVDIQQLYQQAIIVTWL